MAPRRYFFRATDGSLIGPVTLNSVAEMIQAGKVKANTPISVDGAEFKPMKAFPELATLLSVDVALPDASEGDDLLETPATYSGSVTEVSLPKLMYHFTASRANGRLLLTNQAVRKELYLMNGKPVAARSNLDRDRLSRHLVRNDVLNPLQAEQILKKLKDDEEQLADFLIQNKVIHPHKLFEHLREQLLEKIFEVFSWRVGTYAFYDGQEYKGSLLPLNLNPWEIIAQGVRIGYDLSELRQLLEPLRNRIMTSRDNNHVHISQLVLHPRELKIFKSLSSGRTLGGLLDRLGSGDEAEKMVLSMIYMGIEMELVGVGEEIVIPEEPEYGGLENPDAWDAMLDDAFSQDNPGAPAPAPDPMDNQGPFQPTRPITRQEQTLLEILNELKEKNHFERLEVDQNASGGEVSKAFLKAARAHHPDQVPADADARVRDLHSEIFSLLNESHQVLSNDQRREEYRQAIEAGLEDDQVDVTNIMQAESAFQQGELLLNNSRYKEALEQFEEAVKLNPDEGEFWIYRGYAAFFANPNADSMHRERCINDILRGLKDRDNSVPAGFLFLGKIYNAVGDQEKAAKNFKKALALEKNNLEASRELRLLEMRNKKKGFWKK